MMSKYEVVLLIVALVALTIYWMGPVFMYGYGQHIFAQIIAAIAGALIDRFYHT